MADQMPRLHLQTMWREAASRVAGWRQIRKRVRAGVDKKTLARGGEARQELAVQRYLDLLELCLCGLIYQDGHRGWGLEKPFDAELRNTGRDWPQSAHTMIGRGRLAHLRRCVEFVLDEGISGDFIEAGVWRGGACILMRGILAARGVTDRIVHLADSFEGLPPPDAAAYPADAHSAFHEYPELAVPLAEVTETFRRYNLLDGQVRFHKGWFRDTLPNLGDARFALVRLDGDMYESTWISLSELYPRLSPGGLLIIDDYGCVDACRSAVDDYRQMNRIVTPIHEIDWSAVFWRKPGGVANRCLPASIA